MRSKNKSSVREKVYTAILIIFLLIVGIFLVKGGRYIPALFQLIFQKEIHLKTNSQNRVNILLLGVGGGTHDGPNLTDTMIFASIDSANKKVSLASIPRDLWMPELRQKINFAYADGEAKKKGGGIIEAKAAVRELLGQDIDYTVRIDFDGFIKAVDMIGGLEIVVDNVLDDPEYPLSGKENESCGHSEDEIASLSAKLATGSATELDAFPCRYEHLHFNKGAQKMNGITALKFVRSRHAQDGEGSDFARSKRQEKAIDAFKDKIFSAGTFLNPVKVVSLVSVLSSSVDTDIKEDEYDDFIKLAKSLKGAKTTSAILDIGDEQASRVGLLTRPEGGDYDNQYVLVPVAGNGNYSEIQKYINCVIENRECLITEKGITTPTPQPTKSEKEN